MIPHPYLLENSFHVHNLALVRWIESTGLLVDYGDINGIARNKVPPLVVYASPDRAFAEAGRPLFLRKWMEADSAEEAVKKMQEQEVVTLPLISVYQSSFSDDREIAGGAKVFYQRYFNYATGKWDAYQWPTMYRVDYTVMVWTLTRFMNEHILSWFDSQLSQPGAAQDEVFINVDHGAPFGTMLQSLKRTGVSDTSELEGFGKRYIRVTMNFSLRMQVQKKALESDSPSLFVDYEVVRYDDQHDAAEVLIPASPPSPARPSADHFIVPMPEASIPTKWPKIGNSTVQSTYPRKIPTKPAPTMRRTLGIFVKDDTDAVLLWKSITVPNPSAPNPFAIARYRFFARSSAAANLVIEQIGNDGSYQTVHNVPLPVSGNWTGYDFMGTLAKPLFGAHVEGTGDAATVELAAISCVTYLPPAIIVPSSSANDSLSYTFTFSGLPQTSHLFFVGGIIGFADNLRAFVVDEDHATASTAPNQIVLTPDSQLGGTAIRFTPPAGGLAIIRLVSDTTTPPSPTLVGAFPATWQA